MATYKTTTPRFLAAQLENLNGIAIVRYSADRKIYACVGAACRFRNSPKSDEVYSWTPSALWEGAQAGEFPRAERVTITKDRHKLAHVRLYDEPDYTSIFENATPGGGWGMMSFDRMGVKSHYETLEHQLDVRTWNVPRGASAIGNGSTLRLSADAVGVAETYISAWEPMVVLSALIGGVNPDSIPRCAAVGCPDLLHIVENELEIRRANRARYASQQGGSLPREFDPVRLVSTIAKQSDPDIIAAMDAAVKKAMADASTVSA